MSLLRSLMCAAMLTATMLAPSFAATSNSGYKAPSALLKSQFGMEAGKDFEPAFSSKHDNSVIGGANKDYPAAAIANSVMKRMIAPGVIKPEQVVTNGPPPRSATPSSDLRSPNDDRADPCHHLAQSGLRHLA